MLQRPVWSGPEDTSCAHGRELEIPERNAAARCGTNEASSRFVYAIMELNDSSRRAAPLKLHVTRQRPVLAAAGATEANSGDLRTSA